MVAARGGHPAEPDQRGRAVADALDPVRVEPVEGVGVQPLGGAEVAVEERDVSEAAQRRREVGGAARAARDGRGALVVGAGRVPIVADPVVAAVDEQVGGVVEGAEPLGEDEGLVGERDRGGAVAAMGGEPGERVQREGGAPAVAERPEPARRRLEVPPGPLGVTGGERLEPGDEVRGGPRPRVRPVAPGEDQRVRGLRVRLVRAAHHPQERQGRVAARPPVRPHRFERRLRRRAVPPPHLAARRVRPRVQHARRVLLLQAGRRDGARDVQQRGGLRRDRHPADPQVARQRRRQPQPRRDVPRLGGPVQRGQQVAVLGAEDPQPFELAGAAQLRVGGPRQLQEVPRVRVPGLAGVAAALGPVRADRLQHPVPAARQLQQRLVDERLQRVAAVAAHLPRRVRRRAAREDGEPLRDAPLVGGQQVPAPRDDRAQRPVPLVGGAGAARRDAEPVAEPVREVGDVHGAQPRRRQLDRERQVVERRADPPDGPRVRREPAPHRRRPRGEQPDGRVAVQRADGPQVLAGDAERFAARREDAQVRARGEQPRGERGDRVDDVLAVVQDEQRRPVGERRDEPVLRGLRGVRGLGARLAQAERAEQRAGQRRAVPQRRQLGEARRPGRAAASGPARHLDGQPRLPDPAGPGQRHQARGTEQVGDAFDVAVTADERGERRGRPHRRRSGVAAQQVPVQGGEVRGRVRAELVGEAPPRLLEHQERLGPPAAVPQRPHQQPGEPLAQRMPSEEFPQLGHDLAMAAPAHVGLDPVFEGGEPPLVEPRGLGLGPRHVGERRPAPQGQRLAEERGRPFGIAVAQRGASLVREALEPSRVHVAGFDRDPVPAAGPLDRRARAERRPQPRHLGVQRVARRPALRQPVRRDRRARADEQQRQQRPPGRAAERHLLAAVPPRPGLAQDSEPHARIIPARRPRTGCRRRTASSRPRRAGPRPSRCPRCAPGRRPGRCRRSPSRRSAARRRPPRRRAAA
ncbi:hypothetical protein amrb99_25520 [Actinomadura sp. RB99]|nr:hypothetical protein [Actinomadura sp. RB99]